MHYIPLVDPSPVIVTIRDNKDYIGVLSYSHYATIAGWGGQGPPNIYIYTHLVVTSFKFLNSNPERSMRGIRGRAACGLGP